MGAQGVDLAAGPVQGDDEQAMEAFVRGALGCEGFKLRDEARVQAAIKVGSEPLDEYLEPGRLKPRSPRAHERAVVKPGQGISAPQGQGGGQLPCARIEVAGGPGHPPRCRQCLESAQVKVVSAELQGVTAVTGLQRRRRLAERLPEPEHERVDCLPGPARCPVAPQIAHHAIGADRPVALESEPGQQGPLGPAPYDNRPAASLCLEWPEDPDLKMISGVDHYPSLAHPVTTRHTAGPATVSAA